MADMGSRIMGAVDILAAIALMFASPVWYIWIIIAILLVKGIISMF